jgi:predicted nucleotidyltransferase
MTSKLQLLPSDITDRLNDLHERIAGVTNLRALWLFGSFARGEATPISDVDLAFLSDQALADDALNRFETELYVTIAHALHTDEFTFVNLRTAPSFIGWQILKEGRMLF